MSFPLAAPAARRWTTVGVRLALLAPIVAAVVFVQKFATGFPLTDEWFFVRAILNLQGADLESVSGIAQAVYHAPLKFVEHSVVVPFLFYWPIAEWTHFDSRYPIYLTLATFLIQAVLLRAYVVRSTAAMIPIVLVLFCPSHFMEFLWGWQMTLALSIVFPVGGLFVLDRMTHARSTGGRIGLFAAGIVLILLGTFSSAGGFFGFPSAMLLLALEPVSRAMRIRRISVLIVVAATVFLTAMHDPERRDPTFGIQQALQVMMMLGGTIWGSPIGTFEFGFDLRSITGIVVTVATIAVIARAWRVRALPHLALALSITVFGGLCIAAIAASRGYVGNWHLQYALPAVCGAYATAHVLWTRDRTAWSATPFFALCALISACVWSHRHAFATDGPEYREYANEISQYVRRNLIEPGREPPYPPQYDWDMTPRMLLFLSAYGHHAFEDAPPTKVWPLKRAVTVYWNGKPVEGDLVVEGGAGGISMVNVVFREEPRARGVAAQIGDTRLILRRVHADFAPAGCHVEPGGVCFMGMIVPRLLDGGPHTVVLTGYR